MSETVPSQSETSSSPASQTGQCPSLLDCESSAVWTRFVMQWSEKIHTPRVQTIFDVLRDELVRRRGLRAYGIEMKARPRLASAKKSSVGQTFEKHIPKLLSNDRAA